MISREELLENLVLNLEKERVRLGYSQAQMASALHMSLSSYKRLICGESRKIDFYTVFLAQKLTGKLFEELWGYESPTTQKYHLLQNLSEPQRNFVSDIIQFEHDFSSNLKNTENAYDYTTLIIPSGDMQDGMIVDSCSLKKINIAPYRKRYGSNIDCALYVTSNHLHPVYHLNDILLISRSPMRDGDTGIFINKTTGLAYIRKFRQTSPCRLEPIPSYGQIFYVDSNDEADMAQWLKFGHVITKMRTVPE